MYLYSTGESNTSFYCNPSEAGTVTSIDILWRNNTNIVVLKNEIIVLYCKIGALCKPYRLFHLVTNATQVQIDSNTLKVNLSIFNTSKEIVGGHWSLQKFVDSDAKEEAGISDAFCEVFG